MLPLDRWIRFPFLQSEGDCSKVVAELRQRQGRAMNDNNIVQSPEDNPNEVELSTSALREFGVQNATMVVADGVEALDYLLCRKRFAARARQNPALILLEIRMSRVDGSEVQMTLEKEQELQLVPVVMLTPSRKERDLVRCYELGINAHMVKSIDFQSYQEAIPQLGAFWLCHNQPPPSSSRHPGT